MLSLFFMLAGSPAFAAFLNCQYLNPINAFVAGRMAAVISEEEAQREIPARSTYQYWSQDENPSVSSNKYIDYPATITSLLLEPGKTMLFSIENSQASEIVQMKYDEHNKQYIGRRHIDWVAKERLDDPYSSIAICKVN